MQSTLHRLEARLGFVRGEISFAFGLVLFANGSAAVGLIFGDDIASFLLGHSLFAGDGVVHALLERLRIKFQIALLEVAADVQADGVIRLLLVIRKCLGVFRQNHAQAQGGNQS